MRLLSVNVGLPRTMVWEGKTFESGIAKTPVEGRIAVQGVNLDGDGQADLRNHGGPLKAVYAYPFGHYPFWESLLSQNLPMGALGENLTIEGLDEAAVCSGDRLRIGTAEFTVTIPREPCFKLAALRGTDEVVKAMLQSGHSGYYLAIAREGDVGAGDTVELLSQDPRKVRIADLTPLLTGGPAPVETLRRAMELETITPYWRGKVARRLPQGRVGGQSESPHTR